MGFTPTDIGAYTFGKTALLNAAGTTAGTAVNGLTINRLGFSSGAYKSVKILIPYNYVITSGVTIAINAHLQDSPTSTAFTDFGSTVASAGVGSTVTGATGGSSGSGCFQRDVDITTADQYIRVRITPACSVVSTVSYVNYGGVIVMGGGDDYPAA